MEASKGQQPRPAPSMPKPDPMHAHNAFSKRYNYFAFTLQICPFCKKKQWFLNENAPNQMIKTSSARPFPSPSKSVRFVRKTIVFNQNQGPSPAPKQVQTDQKSTQNNQKQAIFNKNDARWTWRPQKANSLDLPQPCSSLPHPCPNLTLCMPTMHFQSGTITSPLLSYCYFFLTEGGFIFSTGFST